jgi:hypothetical protein
VGFREEISKLKRDLESNENRLKQLTHQQNVLNAHHTNKQKEIVQWKQLIQTKEEQQLRFLTDELLKSRNAEVCISHSTLLYTFAHHI